MSLTESIEISEESIREHINKAINDFGNKYSSLPNFLVMSGKGYMMLLKECEGTYPKHKTIKIMKSYSGMDLLMTVKDDMLFELI